MSLLDFLAGRRQSYQVLKTPRGQLALEDLAKFCRANESTFHPDPRVHAVLEGRREVWLRIQQHINLPPEELHRLYAPGQPLNTGEKL